MTRTPTPGESFLMGSLLFEYLGYYCMSIFQEIHP
jgi:hypothetical protein